MADFGKQGTAAPVNVAQPIKAGNPVDWENAPTQTHGTTATGVQVPGTPNNDKRSPR